MDSDSEDEGNTKQSSNVNGKAVSPKSSNGVRVQDIKDGLQKRSRAIGLKAASLAATVNTYRRRISKSVSQESDKDRKVSRIEEITLSRAARDDLLEVIHQRLQEKCNVNEVDEDGLAALHHRSRYNRVNCVKILLDAGADINLPGGSEEMTPLHIACRYNSADVVQTLVASGAALNATDTKGKTALHYATRRGFTTVAKMLLAATNCKVDAADNDRTTPLHMAAEQGCADVTDSLISRGAKVDARDINDMTPLMWAAAEGHCNVMKVLLQRSSKQTWNEKQFVHAQDNEGNTALHFSVMNGKYEATNLLLGHITNVDAQKNNLQTPLHIAATNGFLDIVKLLLKHGADVDMYDNNQRTPVHNAALCNRVDILNELMSHGANLNTRDAKHMSPLHCACWKGQTDAVEFLLDNGAQIAERDNSLMTVLHWAVQFGHYDTLNLLLQHAGPDLLEARDRNDQTVLHYASCSGNTLVLKTLLDNGARCDAKDNEERTPLHIAAQCGNVQCVEALIEKSKHETNDDDVEGRTPLLLASMQGHQQVVQLLLLLGADISCRDDEQRSALMLSAEEGHQSTMSTLLANHASVNDADKLKNTALHYACSGGYVGSVQMLLQARADVTIKNTRDQSALDIAIDNLYSEVAMVMLKHNSWRNTMSVRDKNGCTAFDRLIARLPDAAMAVLDHCVEQSSRDEEDINLTLTFDYHNIDPGPDDPANKKKRYLALNTMIQHGRDDLLSHVVCQNILSHKWMTFGRKVFYANLIVFIFYMFVLTWYTYKIGNIAVTADFDVINYCPVFNETDNQTLYHYYIENGMPAEDMEIRQSELRVMAVILCFISAVFLGREAFKLFQRDWKYLLNPYTWIVVVQAVCLFAFIHPYGYYPCLIQWRAGWLSHFLAWMNFIFYLRKFDFIGIYIIMFEAVFVSLLKAILIYFFFCWAFTGSFYIILCRRHRAFTSMDDGVLNVLTMTLGEIEFVDNFIRDPGVADPFKLDVYILLAIFVFLMPIVLINLMIGVAVGDIEKIQRNAYLKRMALQVELLYNIENTMPKFVQRRLYQRRAVVKPNEESSNKFCSCLQSVRTHISGKRSTQFISVRQKDRVDQAVEMLDRQLATQSKGLKALQATVVDQTNLLKNLCEKIHLNGATDTDSFLLSPDRRSSYDNMQIQHHKASFRR